MSIADQVATVEHDLAAALAQIDALNAAKAALESANASLQRDNVGLQLEVNDMKHYVDDTRAMAEQLANSALDMLRASRRQVGGQAEIIPYASKRSVLEGFVVGRVFSDETIAKATAAIADVGQNFRTDETGKVHLLDTPAQRAVTEIMTGDSGDEHFVAHDLYETGDADAPDTIKDSNGEVVLGLCRKCGRAEIELADRCDTPLVRDERPDRYAQEQDAGLANTISSEPTVFETMQADVTAPLGFIHCKDCPDPPRCTIDSKWCDKQPGPMLVEHGPDDLPIFLRSAPSDRAAVFG